MMSNKKLAIRLAQQFYDRIAEAGCTQEQMKDIFDAHLELTIFELEQNIPISIYRDARIKKLKELREEVAKL